MSKGLEVLEEAKNLAIYFEKSTLMRAGDTLYCHMSDELSNVIEKELKTLEIIKPYLRVINDTIMFIQKSETGERYIPFIYKDEEPEKYNLVKEVLNNE